jgi:hypothetical protein
MARVSLPATALSTVNFGAPAAERDIERGLEDYFVESEAYNRVRLGSKRIVIGASGIWKYLIYVLIMKEISKDKAHLKKGAANGIYRYVRDNHSNQQGSKLSALVSYLKRLEGIKIGKYEATFKARELEKLYKLEEIHYLLPSLREIASGKRIIVLVDEFDRGWDLSEDARAFVAGLFQPCISVNSLHDGLRGYMSLRQELYDDSWARSPPAEPVPG